MIRVQRLSIKIGAARAGDALLLARLAGEALAAQLVGSERAAPSATVSVDSAGRTTPILARDLGRAAAAALSRREG